MPHFLRNLYIFSPYTYFLFFRQVDELRASLYAPFKPELSHKGSIDINDVQGSGDIVTSSFDPTLVPLPPIGPLKRTVLIQVNLFQKHLLLHQLTHNMTKYCSWNYHENYKRRTWAEHCRLIDAKIRASDKDSPVRGLQKIL